MKDKEKKMKKKALLALVAGVFLVSMALTGCGGGVSQESYDALLASFNECKAKIDEANANVETAHTDLTACIDDLKTCRDDYDALRQEYNALREKCDLTGATPAETAAKIVKYYYETHEYSTTDLFICSDMAGEVWNMLKAQGINAVIAIGDTSNNVADILQCTHAWVLAEVTPGEYLALEATGGYVVTKGENAHYYNGWYFDSPAELKRHNDLVKEHNTRVEIILDIHNEAVAVAAQHDASTNPTAAAQLLAVYEKLIEVRDAEDAKLQQVKAELDSLAERL